LNLWFNLYEKNDPSGVLTGPKHNKYLCFRPFKKTISDFFSHNNPEILGSKFAAIRLSLNATNCKILIIFLGPYLQEDQFRCASIDEDVHENCATIWSKRTKYLVQ